MTEPGSLVTLIDDLRRGHLTPSALLAALVERFEVHEAKVRAFVEEESRFERLEADLAALEARWPDAASRPPLWAVPVGIKDIFQVDGFDTRAGSRLPPEELAGPEGPAVARLRRAGSLFVGKTVTTEFAYFAPGPTRNPHAPAHTPGGSSSGSAAAVAAGLVPLALGTQTIGSINRPAAFCGVVGVKPSYGRIPLAGVIPLAPSLDHVGFFTTDVAGAAAAAAVLIDDWRSEIAAPRGVLGVPDGPYLASASPQGRRHFERVLARLGASGTDLVRVETLLDFGTVRSRHDRLMAAENAVVHRAWYGRFRDCYHPKTAALIERGQAVPAGDLATLRAGRTALRERLEATMDRHGVGVWITPSAPGPAPPGLDATGDPVMNLPFTHAGLPTVTLPAGTNAAGLPLGIQLVGRFGADESLFAIASTLEGRLG